MNNNTNTQQYFVWTEDAIKEFIFAECNKHDTWDEKGLQQYLDEFKKSKQQHTIEGDKRIRVGSFGIIDDRGNGWDYGFFSPDKIPREKFREIMDTIKKVLRNEVDNPVLDRQQESKQDSKDWEIISVEDGVQNGSQEKGKLVVINKGDEITWIKLGTKIHSVRRISDNCVFSVGKEYAADGYSKHLITGFSIGESDMRVHARWVDWADGYLPLKMLTAEPSPIAEQPKQVEKPPLGIMPQYLWVEQRINDLDAAVTRYINACKKVPDVRALCRPFHCPVLHPDPKQLMPGFVRPLGLA